MTFEVGDVFEERSGDRWVIRNIDQDNWYSKAITVSSMDGILETYSESEETFKAEVLNGTLRHIKSYDSYSLRAKESKCTCDISMLMLQGCKCGHIQKERKAK